MHASQILPRRKVHHCTLHGPLPWSPADEGVILEFACFQGCSSGSEHCLGSVPGEHFISPEQWGKAGHKHIGAIYKSHIKLEPDSHPSGKCPKHVSLPPEYRCYGNLFFSAPRDRGSQWVWGFVIFLLVDVAINLAGCR